MLRYIYANDLTKYPTLATTMFKDRADQFKTRLVGTSRLIRRGPNAMPTTGKTRFM